MSSLRAYDRAVFRVDVPDPFTDLSVFTGWVDAEGSGGKTRVNAGRTLTSAKIEKRNWPGSAAPTSGKAGMCNGTSGLLHEATVTDIARRVAGLLQRFDDHGRWVQSGIRLRLDSQSDCRGLGALPVRAMIGGAAIMSGYVEPWGWTPYDYGRWAYAPRVGWFWVPPQRGQVYWGPGYVG